MSNCRTRIATLPRRTILLALCLIMGVTAGCGRKPSKSKSGDAADDPDKVTPPARVDYTFAETLRDQYPEVTAFMQQFLETCLAGDYAGYRRMVSYLCDPESRDRFQTVLHAIESLRVESIESIDRPQFGHEVYRVVCSVAFKPDSKARLRRRGNALAILVLKEEGQWRMMPAPAGLQPEEESTATSSAPTTSGPSYPWDEDGDY